MDVKEFKNPEVKYRPKPFWSWNDKLEPNEVRRQVDEMAKAGLGGFFMHARGGLKTEYLSKEWFENVLAAVEEAKKLGIEPWGYDEDGWPSGFGGGKVNGKGDEYRQKILRFEKTDEPKNTEHTVTNIKFGNKNLHIYYDINLYYTDTVNGKVIDEFINVTHKEYKNRMGEQFTDMKGFFTDEPQVCRGGMPWSEIIPQEYKKKYGEELVENLHALFVNFPGAEHVRANYFALVRDLFAENYFHRIQKWCNENSSRLTGHLIFEEGLSITRYCSGAVMAGYEFFDIPGMDHLGRNLASIQTEMQLSSVGNQLGKKQLLSETFALSGWNVNFEEMRAIFEHQLVHGVNLLCQHLEGYTLKGLRKRDYPASLFVQQPWWEEYNAFNDYVSRVGKLIAEGEVHFDVLLLHAIESAWLLIDNEQVVKMCNDFIDTINSLENELIQYHLGDARIMERYGSVEGNKIKIGTQSYSTVVVPPTTNYCRNTFELLKKFKENGGKIIFSEIIPSMIDGIPTDEFEALANGCVQVNHKEVGKQLEEFRKISIDYEKCDSPLFATVREFDDRTMYYVVNPNEIQRDVKITVNGASAEIFDPATGEIVPAVFEQNGEKIILNHRLHKNGSVIFFVCSSAKKSAQGAKDDLVPLDLSGKWNIKSSEYNALTLDYCDVCFDGKESFKNVPILDVQEKAAAYMRSVKTKLTFKFDIRQKEFSCLKLAIEEPKKYNITLNGQHVSNLAQGYYRDKSFELLDISKQAIQGENVLELECDFVQQPGTYEAYKRSLVFESEKNMFSWDFEIESVYVLGDFGVFTNEKFVQREHRGITVSGGFYIGKKPETVYDGSIAEQGFPFFSTVMTLEKTISLKKDELLKRAFKLSKLPSCVTKVKINGVDAGKIIWQPYQIDVSSLLKEGENTIEVTIMGNLRNMLGPHHLRIGECLNVTPQNFYHDSELWNSRDWATAGDDPWRDDYTFVEYGLFFK